MNARNGGPSDRDLTAFGRTVGAVMWCSFLTAAAATMVCFAFVDPDALAHGAAPSWWTGRSKIYALGFFALWATAVGASALTLFVARRP